jgi:preprotein translocase subunit SecA
MSVFDRFLRAGEGKKVKRLAELVGPINALEPEMERLSDEELARQTVVFRERLERGETLEDLLVEAFATVREAARRTIGQRHFDVQMMGGMALHFGWIAEMKTGEGKTLVSTLPAYLNALAGHGVHMVTVNDYLAARDSEWMGKIHRFLGLSVGLIVPGVEDPATRRAAYDCDITYGTNTEFGFDYLRDNMVASLDAMVQRGHHFAIVDEVDSILIDEARTPLIISGPSTESAKLYYQFASIVRTLRRDVDYEVDEEKRVVVPLEAGIDKVEHQLGVENMYDSVSVNYVHHLTQALRAKELYHRDKEYIVHDGEVKIVDEFTGRILEGRRWSDGLHQAVEAKERVRIKEENHTWATVTLQNYFRMYEKLAGMTGTAETEAAEFANTYNMQVVPIPTNRPMIRVDHGDLIFKTEAAKFEAVVADIEERFARGQPVLVGTASVEKSELLSSMLEKKGIPHSVLNAKQHAREAAIVAQAGRLHAVTVATNMAGRGVDIILGGNPEGLAREKVLAEGLDPASEEGGRRYRELLDAFASECAAEGDKVRELGGLYVLGSERHESRRIDNQLRGRSGRQGDPGESRFYLSLEDDLMRRFATGAMSWVMEKTLPDDVPIEAKMVTKAVERAQTTVEAVNSEIRKDVLKYDEVMNEQRKVIYERRLRILEGEDLRERTLELLESAIRAIVEDTCPSPYPEEWNLESLLAEVAQLFPTKFEIDDFASAESPGHIADSIVAEAISYYEDREQNAFPGGPSDFREVERAVMLQIIDQRWREHLAEMDYLREGINLRAMGQQDPLVAWQREGFDMFRQLIDAIDDDYLRYVLHVQAVVPAVAQVDLDQASYIAQTDPLATAELAGAGAGLADVQTGPGRTGGPPGAGAGSEPPVAPPSRPAPSADAAVTGKKLNRNDPCFCGSGKKFKYCHGRG